MIQNQALGEPTVVRRLHFNKPNDQVDETIERLMDLVGPMNHPEIVREMILAALKAGQETDSKADLKRTNTDKISARNVAEYLIAHSEKVDYQQHDQW